MAHRLMAQDGRTARREQIAAMAGAARLRHGAHPGAGRAMLDDRSVSRLPVSVRFDSGPAEPVAAALRVALGETAGDGCGLCIHPAIGSQRGLPARVIAYTIPTVRFGRLVPSEEAELFGTTLVGMETDTYYRAMCEIADSLPSAAARAGEGDS
jgi:hypothetical protein